MAKEMTRRQKINPRSGDQKMAHEIDMTTGIPAIAYVGAKPWHGLGQEVDADASIDEWREQAGLNWDAIRTPVLYQNGSLREFGDKHVLYRSDTNAPLSVVSKDYRIVQPSDVLAFFRGLVERNHAKMETLGAIREGRRIWAMARLGENARVMDDEVAPYLMLATSYDGSMATIAQFTTVRVVCNNTLQASLMSNAGQHRISIPHSAIFKPSEVKDSLGLKVESWERFIDNANAMAQRKITPDEADEFLLDLFSPFARMDESFNMDKLRASKGYRSVMDLFRGAQIGGFQEAVNDSAWGMLNAVTEYIDHHKGRTQDRRLDTAWFGLGAKIKARGLELAEKLAA